MPNEGLFVDFLIKMTDVSAEVLDSIDHSTSQNIREDLINERIKVINDRETQDTHYWSEVKSFFGGSEY